MRTLFPLFSLALVVACSPASDETGLDTDSAETDTFVDSDTTEGPCVATVVQIIPLDGSLGVGVEEELSVTFSEALNPNDVTASLVAADASVVDVTVELAPDGLSGVIGHPALAESTAYTLSVSACDAPSTTGFTTTAGPVDETIEHGTYALDYATVDWVQPAWASAFRGLLGLDYVLVEVLDVDLALQELDAVGAVGFLDAVSGDIYQGACYDPMIYNNVDFSDNPSFQAGPSDLYIPSGNLTIANLRIQAAFSDSGDALVGIDITGQIDARQIQENYPILDACVLATNNGDSCVACDSDGTLNCLNLWLSADEAPLVNNVIDIYGMPGLDETYVAADDSRCNP